MEGGVDMSRSLRIIRMNLLIAHGCRRSCGLGRILILHTVKIQKDPANFLRESFKQHIIIDLLWQTLSLRAGGAWRIARGLYLLRI